jgi:hypothetical protein
MCRELILMGKAQYGLPPCINELRSAGFDTAKIIYFFYQNNPNEELNCTGPSPSARVPCAVNIAPKEHHG